MRLDALGLAAFSIIGCQVGLNMGLHYGICVVAAIVTGVFGGLLRDLICRQAPLVLHHELYASVALLVSTLCQLTVKPVVKKSRFIGSHLWTVIIAEMNLVYRPWAWI